MAECLCRSWCEQSGAARERELAALISSSRSLSRLPSPRPAPAAAMPPPQPRKASTTTDTDTDDDYDPVAFQADLDLSVQHTRSLVASWIPTNLATDWTDGGFSTKQGNDGLQSLKDRARPPRSVPSRSSRRAPSPGPISVGAALRAKRRVLTHYTLLLAGSDSAHNPPRSTSSSPRTARSPRASSAAATSPSATTARTSPPPRPPHRRATSAATAAAAATTTRAARAP